MDPITLLGISAVLAGMLLIFLEVANPGIYIIVPGTVLIVVGILALVAQDFLFSGAGAIVLVLVGTGATWGTIQAYRKWARPGTAPVTMASDSLPGHVGKVEKEIPAGGQGYVRVEGQSWRAEAQGGQALAVGTKITVVSADSLVLTVAPGEGS